MNNVQRYLALRARELELRERVIATQNPVVEEERVRVAVEREELLFELTLDELGEILEKRSQQK